MMESVCLDDASGTDADWDSIDPGYGDPPTPSTLSDSHPETAADALPQQHENANGASDRGDSEEDGAEKRPRSKKGGYDSRVEQILYENPELPILIVDAGKSSESGGKYIVYTIRTGVGFQGGLFLPQKRVAYSLCRI
jgi:hypothetical protein